MTSQPNRTRLRTGTIMLSLLSVLLIGSAVAKFAQVPGPTAELAALGFAGGRLTFIAVLEISSAILFLIPRTRALGLLLISAYLGGAVATHIGHGQSMAMARPGSVLALIWIAAWLRHPQVLWSLTGGAEASH